MSIGEIILELRKERGISQMQLATDIGVSQSTIAKIEINRNEATAATIRKLADYFEVSTDFLLGLEDDFGAKTATGITTNAGTVAPMSDHLTPDERQVMENFRRLNPNFQNVVKQTIETLLDNSSDEVVKRNKYK